MIFFYLNQRSWDCNTCISDLTNFKKVIKTEEIISDIIDYVNRQVCNHVIIPEEYHECYEFNIDFLQVAIETLFSDANFNVIEVCVYYFHQCL